MIHHQNQSFQNFIRLCCIVFYSIFDRNDIAILWGPPPPAVQVHSNWFLEQYLVPDHSVFVPIYQQVAILNLRRLKCILGGSSVHGGSRGFNG